MAESPLLLIGGAAPTLLKGRGALQDIDQGVLFRPLCKFTARITKLRDIALTVRKAIQVAQSGTPGPVFIEFPIDVLYPYQFVVKEMGFSPNPKGFKVRFKAVCIINETFSKFLCLLKNVILKKKNSRSSSMPTFLPTFLVNLVVPGMNKKLLHYLFKSHLHQLIK